MSLWYLTVCIVSWPLYRDTNKSYHEAPVLLHPYLQWLGNQVSAYIVDAGDLVQLHKAISIHSSESMPTVSHHFHNMHLLLGKWNLKFDKPKKKILAIWKIYDTLWSCTALLSRVGAWILGTHTCSAWVPNFSTHTHTYTQTTGFISNGTLNSHIFTILILILMLSKVLILIFRVFAPTLLLSEWVINGLSLTSDSEVYVVHISCAII